MALQDKIYSYFDRNPGLHVLFFFDPTGMKEEDLADVQWREGYRFLAPRGGWFSIKYLIDRDWAADKVILYFAQLSPFKLKQEFPLMDLLRANMEYHDEDYAAFMQHYRLKSDYAPYVSSHIAELQSDKMLNLLKPHFADGSFNTDLANRAFISLYLDKSPKLVLDWQNIIIRLILLADTDEEAKRSAFYGRLAKNMDAYRAIDSKLERIFGCKLLLNTEERVNVVVQKLKYNSIVQSLPVSKADNYKQLRIDDPLALQDINNIMEQGTADPKRGNAFRRVLRTLAADIHEQEIVNVYGVDAPYWTVTPNMAWAILQAVIDNKLDTDPQQALDRMSELLMKCTNQAAIAEAVAFSTFTAQYYEAAKAVKSPKLNTPDEYVSRYCSEFYLLDYYYRKAVGSYYTLDSTVPMFASLERAKDALDAHYHKFVNRINFEWIDCLNATGGFARVTLPRQQDFFDKYVKPMSVKVVVIISDALRYEVAKQLEERLTQLRHPTRFEAVLAMLPTETCYCKNALLPHDTLHFVEAQKMMVDGQLLVDTASRQKLLQRYVPNAVCKQYKTIAENSRDENREICKHEVVYIYHDTIDESSHGNKPTKAIADSCERAVDELARLVKSLHGSWNATHVIVTSDHGFLFNDIRFEEKDKQKVTEDAAESKSRYYITSSKADVTNITKFPLPQVSAFDNADLQVAVPVGTNRLYKEGGDYVFCHGGAALQEMIVPVIVSHRQDDERRGSVEAMVLEPNLRMTSSRVKFTVLQKDAVGGANKERNILCAIFDGETQVSPMLPLTLNRAEAAPDARKFPVELTLNKPTTAGVLELRIYDADDLMNPYIKKSITNNTLIQMDDF